MFSGSHDLLTTSCTKQSEYIRININQCEPSESEYIRININSGLSMFDKGRNSATRFFNVTAARNSTRGNGRGKSPAKLSAVETEVHWEAPRNHCPMAVTARSKVSSSTGHGRDWVLVQLGRYWQPIFTNLSAVTGNLSKS